MPYTSRQLRSTITDDAKLELSLATVEIPDPGADEVIVRIEAAPLNPSDMGLLFGPADMTTARAVGTDTDPVVRAEVPQHLMAGVATRVGQSMPVGNEGAGVVVATGDSAQAKALAGKVVSIVGGSAYSQYRALHVGMCQAMPEGTTPEQAASWFVNPMTVLAMLETMRLDGHSALVHTAAASNLGQMLNKVCIADGVPLVNIVRRPDQAEILRAIGAAHVVNSSSPDFEQELVAALKETRATLAFDAIGGGTLLGQILTAMEIAASASATEYSRYGSSTHKQAYIYGSLDRSPTVLERRFGFAWSVGGWLLPPTLARLGGDVIARLRERVASEITTTFASSYTRRVSLPEALSLDAISTYRKQATGEKYLITPHPTT